MKRGLFIAFEGTDGSGKSTQCRLFSEWLRQDGRKVISIREPGGTELGEKLREHIKYHQVSPVTELFLLAASRSELVTQTIFPAVKSGIDVVSDRFSYSTLAYQGYGRGLDLRMVKEITEASTCGILPDVTFFIDVDPKIARSRTYSRGTRTDNFESRGEEFFEKVREGYLKIAKDNPQRVFVISGEGGAEDVKESILQRWNSFLIDQQVAKKTLNPSLILGERKDAGVDR